MQIVNGNTAGDVAQARQQLDETLLERLVGLNAERVGEEARGLVRWLRPEFQNPSGATAPTQRGLDAGDEEDVAVKPGASKKQPWPKDLTEQVRAVTAVLGAASTPMAEAEIAALFTGRGNWRTRLPQLLEMLTALGRARELGGRYVSGS